MRGRTYVRTLESYKHKLEPSEGELEFTLHIVPRKVGRPGAGPRLHTHVVVQGALR